MGEYERTRRPEVCLEGGGGSREPEATGWREGEGEREGKGEHENGGEGEGEGEGGGDIGRDQEDPEVDASAFAKENAKNWDATALEEPGEFASTPRKTRTGTTFGLAGVRGPGM